jgi:hypothetical protein
MVAISMIFISVLLEWGLPEETIVAPVASRQSRILRRLARL